MERTVELLPENTKTPKSKVVEMYNDLAFRHQGWLANLTKRKRTALKLALVACFLIVLSVSHLTEAIAAITHTNIVMAALMAVGIDIGMIVSEFSKMNSKKESEEYKSAKQYVFLTVVLSMGLNAYAFAHNSEAWSLFWIASLLFGIVLPYMIWLLGHQASLKWNDEVDEEPVE